MILVKYSFSNFRFKTVNESSSARVLVGCKPTSNPHIDLPSRTPRVELPRSSLWGPGERTFSLFLDQVPETKVRRALPGLAGTGRDWPGLAGTGRDWPGLSGTGRVIPLRTHDLSRYMFPEIPFSYFICPMSQEIVRHFFPITGKIFDSRLNFQILCENKMRVMTTSL